MKSKLDQFQAQRFPTMPHDTIDLNIEPTDFVDKKGVNILDTDSRSELVELDACKNNNM